MNDGRAPEPPVPGLVAGRYALTRMIGRGGMGEVWEARHHSLGTLVAIKFIDARHVASPQALARFQNEAHAAAAIQSRHAITVIDHGVTDTGRPYIVMELLSGESLQSRLERVGRLTPPETVHIVTQVSRALSVAHAARIVHRDLKPDNIFLTRDEEGEIAKVLDFGIAKLGLGGMPSATRTGTLLGTPYYMSPEQVREAREVDARSDIWSLGVITFQCMTGSLPFAAQTVGDLFLQICTMPVPLPSQFARDLPPALDVWFLHATEREPVRRFASAAEAADELARVCGLSSRRLADAPAKTVLADTALLGAAPPPPLSSSAQAWGQASQDTASAQTAGEAGPSVLRRALRTITLAWIVAGAALLALAVVLVAVVVSGREVPPSASSGAPNPPPTRSAPAAALSIEPVTPTEPASSSAATASASAAPRGPAALPKTPPPAHSVAPPAPASSPKQDFSGF
jgi:eukaryotic-like serine/threonine-protein kinase